MKLQFCANTPCIGQCLFDRFVKFLHSRSVTHRFKLSYDKVSSTSYDLANSHTAHRPMRDCRAPAFNVTPVTSALKSDAAVDVVTSQKLCLSLKK